MPAQTPVDVLRLCVRRVMDGESIHRVAYDAQIHISTVYRAARNQQRHRDVVKPQQKGGRPREINEEIIKVRKKRFI